jgi:hypothetical protein
VIVSLRLCGIRRSCFRCPRVRRLRRLTWSERLVLLRPCPMGSSQCRMVTVDVFVSSSSLHRILQHSELYSPSAKCANAMLFSITIQSHTMTLRLLIHAKIGTESLSHTSSEYSRISKSTLCNSANDSNSGRRNVSCICASRIRYSMVIS